MFHIIYKGIIIGILVSVPMGPIGLLCIQRTLHKGRWYGFFSGLGAALSDFLYASIACSGMKIIISCIEKNRLSLQTLGSILLIVFGIFIFLNDPSKSLESRLSIAQGPEKTKKIKSYSYLQSVLTVFLLAFSNPIVIFLYIGLFNSFNFLVEKNLYIKTVGLFCIFIGSLLWWLTITYLATKSLKIFKIKKLYIINKIMGIIIMFLAFGVIVYSLVYKGGF